VILLAFAADRSGAVYCAGGRLIHAGLTLANFLLIDEEVGPNISNP